MRVLHRWKDVLPVNAVYIGRPSKWGNPFVIGRDGNREEVNRKFENYLLSNPKLLEEARRVMQGKDLICFCAPEACHGDIFIKHIENT